MYDKNASMEQLTESLNLFYSTYKLDVMAVDPRCSSKYMDRPPQRP